MQRGDFPEKIADLIGRKEIIEKAVGTVRYGVKKDDAQMRELRWRRSLFAVNDIRAGERFSIKNIRSIRPANGLPPKYMNDILRKKARKPIPRGTPLSLSLVK